MVKRILILALVLMVFGVSAVAAQQVRSSACDPYQLGSTNLTIETEELSAAPANSLHAGITDIGINTDVLMALADNITEVQIPVAEFANPATRLNPAEAAIVTRDDELLNVYDGACLDTPVVTELMEGMRVTVLDGPIASDGYAWWRVRRGEITGWVIEGDGNEVWLQGLQ